MTLKTAIKKLVPKQLLSLYHLSLAYFGAALYGNPSRKIVVIGVLGTRGKTTTSNYIWSVLTAAGYKVGQTGTANIRIGDEERLNPYHMTMPGRFRIQKLLAEMVKAECEIAIIETPSEGVEQFRHKGIAYDLLVFTVLYPERLAIHNWDPERCTQKSIEPFTELINQPRKKLRDSDVPKTIIVNRDSDSWDRFWNHTADKKISFGTKNPADIQASGIEVFPDGEEFLFLDTKYRLNIPGEYNIMNALPSIAVCHALGIPDKAIYRGLASLSTVPGRMEKISAGQFYDVYVDYAHDGPSMEALLHAAHKMRHTGSKVIIAVGAEGGGRDKEKRPVMGRLCAQLADVVVVTDVDPYEDAPSEIRQEIIDAAIAEGKTLDLNLFNIADRRLGIRKCLSEANSGDIVIITGKGAEQSMEIGGKSIPWDDRRIVREEIASLKE